MTANEARAEFRLLLAGWPQQRQKLDSDDVAGLALLFTEGLADIEAARVRAAIRRLAMTSEFMPNVATIRAALGVIEHGRAQAGAEAFGAVRMAMQKQGSHKAPGVDFTFKDPITRAVVSMLGWSALCASLPDAARARFIDAYEQIQKHERTEAQASPGARSPTLDRGARDARPLPMSELTKRLPGGDPEDDEGDTEA